MNAVAVDAVEAVVPVAASLVAVEPVVAVEASVVAVEASVVAVEAVVIKASVVVDSPVASTRKAVTFQREILNLKTKKVSFFYR